MKKLFLIICYLLLFFTYSPTQNKFRLTMGSTISYFLNAENSSPKLGLAIGISKKFYLYKKFSLYTGLGFASRGAILKNRTIAPYAADPTDAYYQDIHGMLGYLEVPAAIQYEIAVSKKIKIKAFIGPIFTFPVMDLTHFDKKEFFNVYIPGESDIFDYDFWLEQDSGFNNNITKTGLAFGLRFIYKKYALELRYVLDNRDVFHFKNLSEVHQKMNSIYFLISF